MLSKKNKLIEFENKRPIIYDLIYDKSKINSPDFKNWPSNGLYNSSKV